MFDLEFFIVFVDEKDCLALGHNILNRFYARFVFLIAFEASIFIDTDLA